MPIGLRIFLGYILIVGIGAYFLVNIFMNELKPGVRRSTEETLVDTANVLAELVTDDVLAGTVAGGRFGQAVDAYTRRKVNAQISGVMKGAVNHRVYVTDERGIVLYDSDGRDVGKDYSRWNDVYRTLRGQYGARSTRADPRNDQSSVMHVAAPVKHGDKIIGVVTVAKPNLSVQPFIEMGRRKLMRAGLLLVALSLLVAIAFSLWLSGAIRQLVRYVDDLSAGRRVTAPRLQGELAVLGQAVSKLRTQLDGKTYVEEYVHALTHEMKSPIAAIGGAAELLDEDMPAADRARFLSNIRTEVNRLQQVIERLLDLAMVEQRQALETRVDMDPAALLKELVQLRAPQLKARGVTVDDVGLQSPLAAQGDPFLVRQALSNLLDNAIAFAPANSVLTLTSGSKDGRCWLGLHNQGDPIPDFALDRVFERFYSLPRPETQKKSTGLGLPFVREVAALHGGEIRVANHPQGGVEAVLTLPCA
ncbi:MAG: two-component system sensor histidine kinase CreC [Deltaproteobacteria bacterium]|nr:two-component system sensor histidine kinase CreC [Deltaproteobacteria bacterium]